MSDAPVHFYMIAIVPYRPTWPGELLELGRALREALGELALRVDHIGSTAVPGLPAKDILDVQITVASLDAAVARALERAGFERVARVTGDHVPPGGEGSAGEWIKWLFKPPADRRPVNVHVRLPGRANQRYALLFRDYLRAHPTAAEAYAQVKMALARHHAGDVDAYYDVKDPVCDIIMIGAEAWAAAVGWSPGPTDA